MKHENEIGKLQQKEATEKEDGNKSAREIWREKKRKLKLNRKKARRRWSRGKETIVQMKNFINSDVNQE